MDTKIIILGNAISLIGCLLMVMVGLIKDRRRFLIVQTAQFGIMGLANFILGGFTGCLTNIASMARNIIFCYFKYTVKHKIFFIAIQVLLSFKLNSVGLIGWLPILSTALFTWFLDIKSDLHMKYLIAITVIMWIIYDFTIMNFTACAFDAATLISSIIGAYRIISDTKKGKETAK